ncbi:MAG: CotH kinase family protein [Bacteroidota bacterium]
MSLEFTFFVVPEQSFILLRTLIILASYFLLLTTSALAQNTYAPSKDTLVVEFDPRGGFYQQQQQLRLSAYYASEIFYTLDGSTPSRKSLRYNGPIYLDKTTVVRAIAYHDEQTGPRVGSTYFINEPASSFPVVSIGISPGILFNPSRGIFVQGSNAVDSVWHKPGANFWSRSEFPMQLEIYDTDGQQQYNNLTGMRLFGGMSRLFPQKSLALIARKRYGKSRFKGNFFGSNDPSSFKFLVLRNSGSDFGKSHFRDGLMTSLVDHWDLETQAFRPSHVYINGRYWGIYNIREKVNRYFVSTYAEDVHRDSLDLLEHFLVRKRGSRQKYQEMLNFLERYDLDLQANFDYLTTFMEVDNFMEHQIAQIYFDNRDAGGNIKYWRPKTEEGRWRWILYDTDWGYGLHNEHAYRANSLAFHTKANGPHWPNPPWSTFLLRKLLQNEGFRQKFITRFADHLNTSFSEETATHLVDSFYFMFQPEIGRHLKRWRLSETKWRTQVDIMRDFAQKRPAYMRDDLADYFDAGDTREVHLIATEGGQVLVNNYLEVSHLNGLYFANYPVNIRAIPNYGYHFIGWDHDIDAARELSLDLQQDRRYRYHAFFEPFTDPLMDQVVINEVCPKSKKTDDWLEIFNNTEETLQLEGWVLTDQRNEFIFPKVELLPNDYIVVCKDANKFRETFPDAYNVIGGMGFGLNKRSETLGLYTSQGAAVDSFAYQLPPLDTAFTLSLHLPDADNADMDNWQLSPGLGTPNSANPQFIATRVRIEQAQWLRMGLAAGVVVLCLFLLYWRQQGS